MKKYIYYQSIQWTEGKDKFAINTQLYQTAGVYVALTKNSRHYTQFCADPAKFGKAQKKQIAKMKTDRDTYTLGSTITVFKNEKGLWEEIT